MADPNPNPNSQTTLTTPLLSPPPTSEVVLDIPIVSSSSNPFAFLGAPDLALPPPCPVDPFRNHTPSILGGGVYEWVKILLCLPIAAVRLALFGLSLVVGFLATRVALLGWREKQNPMPRWRCGIMWITRISGRCILFSFGYHWIKRIGRPASRKTAPVVVCNHISYIDPIFFFYELFPTIVASESHDSLPFVGTIIRAMQVIYVDRFSAASRKFAVSEIKRKASSDEFPRVLLFPEGTTSNGRVLLSFQLGAFIPGLPIQPVVIRYPYVHFDQSWGNISLLKLMFRMFTQFHNFMEVEYLPILAAPKKIESPTQFAKQAGYAMASSLNVVQTNYSYGDSMLLTRASESVKGKLSPYLVEMARIQNTYNINTPEAMEFLDKFLAMNPDANGRVRIHGFLDALKLGSGTLAVKIFEYFDVEHKESITFREFLLGSAHIMSQPSFLQICEAVFDAHLSKSNGHLITQQVSDLLCLFGMSKDEVMNKKDFMAFMRKNPLLVAFFHDEQLEEVNHLRLV